MQQTIDTFGQRVRRLRLRRALTQVELAELAGVSTTAIIRIERDMQLARPSTVRKIARALDLQPVEITAP